MADTPRTKNIMVYVREAIGAQDRKKELANRDIAEAGIAQMEDDLAAAKGQIEALKAENERLTDKALRYDLDQAGITNREQEAIELVELRAEKAEAENAALKAEAGRNARDAERYREARRWHNPPMDTPFICILQNGVFTALTEEFADERLDAAIAQGK